MALLKLNVILLAPLPIPPLPVIVMVGTSVIVFVVVMIHSSDTLTGAGGRDIFDYGFKNAGNDTITDFTRGNTKTNTNADIIDLSDLLVGYSATSNLSDFVTACQRHDCPLSSCCRQKHRH
jgi:hypothetical protein